MRGTRELRPDGKHPLSTSITPFCHKVTDAQRCARSLQHSYAEQVNCDNFNVSVIASADHDMLHDRGSQQVVIANSSQPIPPLHTCRKFHRNSQSVIRGQNVFLSTATSAGEPERLKV
jgi:hypothetical protein